MLTGLWLVFEKTETTSRKNVTKKKQIRKTISKKYTIK